MPQSQDANTSLKYLLLNQSRLLADAGVESARLSAELLLAHAMNIDRSALLKELLLHPDAPLSDMQLTAFNSYCARRLAHEPVAYITGYKEFYGREFAVTPATLIPRPETELIIDEALRYFRSAKPGCFADLGTGSGCIGITLTLELAGWQGKTLDISTDALKVAQKNKTALKAENLELVPADFTKYLFEPAGLDLLVTNPPYISEAEYDSLTPSVRSFEPKTALVPGKEGTEHLVQLCQIAANAIKPNGLFLMEFGCTQGAFVYKLFKNAKDITPTNAALATPLSSTMEPEKPAALDADSINASSQPSAQVPVDDASAKPPMPRQLWRDVRIIKDLAGLDRILYAVRA